MSSPSPEKKSISHEDRQPIFVDEVDSFQEFIDHDTRGEPGYQPSPRVSIVPRIEKPIQPPDGGDLG